jgi:hypothetical protein
MGTGVPHEGLSTSAIEGETEVSGPWCKRRPISDVGNSRHRPTIVLYEHSVSPSPGGAS